LPKFSYQINVFIKATTNDYFILYTGGIKATVPDPDPTTTTICKQEIFTI